MKNYTLRQLASTLRVTEVTLFRWSRGGYLNLPPRQGRQYEISQGEVERLLDLAQGEALPDLLTVEEVCKVLICTKGKVSHAVQKGQIRILSLPQNTVRVKRSEIERLLEVLPGDPFPLLMTSKQIADDLRISPDRVSQWIRDGEIFAYRLFGEGAEYRVPRPEIEGLLGIAEGEPLPKILSSSMIAQQMEISPSELQEYLKLGWIQPLQTSFRKGELKWFERDDFYHFYNALRRKERILLALSRLVRQNLVSETSWEQDLAFLAQQLGEEVRPYSPYETDGIIQEFLRARATNRFFNNAVRKILEHSWS